MDRPKGGIEQARRNMMRDDRELYEYIEARIAARELDRAGDDCGGALNEYGAANRVWSLSARWENKWRSMLAAEAEVAAQPPTPGDVAVLVEQEDGDTTEDGDVAEDPRPEQVPGAGGVI